MAEQSFGVEPGVRPENGADLTIAGVAWRVSPSGAHLVVIGRGSGGGQMRSAFATLTIVHSRDTVTTTAPVTVTVGGARASRSRQTLRFVFRLPAAAPSWSIEKLLLRWRGAEIEIPHPQTARNGSRTSESALSQLLASTAGGTQNWPIAVDHAEGGRDAPRDAGGWWSGSRQWVATVMGELEVVAEELAACREELDRVSRTLVARSLAESPPGPDEAAQADQTVPPPSSGKLEGALAELRRKLEHAATEDATRRAQAPTTPADDAQTRTPHAAEPSIAPAAEPSIAPAAEPFMEPAAGASSRWPAAMTPASLPGRVEHLAGEASWFSQALRRLAEDDHEAAGAVLVNMLPAQAIATPRALRYDLILRGHGIYAVDARPLDSRVLRLEEPRTASHTDAWITATLGQLGQLIASGRSRVMRRLRRPAVTVKGERARLGDLLDLATAPLRLRDLCAVGATIPPDLLLRMVAGSWSANRAQEQEFSIRFESEQEDGTGCALLVHRGTARFLADGGAVSEPTTLVRASGSALMNLLADLPSGEHDEPVVKGSPAPLRHLQACIRALEFGRG